MKLFNRPFPFYRQYDAMDCGPTCLQMITRYYGKKTALEDIRKMCEINKSGVNLLGINNTAEQLGFSTVNVKISLHDLVAENNLPAILHWDQNHFVVLYKIKRRKYYIADPGTGKIVLNETDFKKHWCINTDEGIDEGIALLLEPSETFSKATLPTTIVSLGGGEDQPKAKKIIDYLKGQKKGLAVILLTLLIALVFQSLLPYITKNVVDKGIRGKDLHFLILMLIGQFCLLCGRLIIEFIRGAAVLKIGTQINISILSDFIIKLIKLPLSFFDAQTKGSIMQRMNDHSRIENFITGSSLSILFSTISLVVFSVVLASYSLIIFAVFVTASIIYAVWVISFLSRKKQLDYKRFELAAKEQNVTMQLLEGIQEIKLFGMENTIQQKWKQLQLLLYKINMRIFRLNQWQQTGAVLINEAKNIVILFIAATFVINGQITLGTMMAIQMIIGQLNSPVEQFLSFLQSWQNANISMNRINEIHLLTDEENEHAGKKYELPKLQLVNVVGGKPAQEQFAANIANNLLDAAALFNKEGILFKNVSYTYPGAGNERVLNDITATIPVGKTTAIVGMSGSGKTTFLKLLLKYYEPQEGAIHIGGLPLLEYDHKLWRSKCGTVMQDSYIFPDTIAQNIALGIEKIDRAQLINAAKTANIYDFIEELPLGFETKIGVEGHGISIGQRQRILIARAVYKDPEFIFFDEATNSLDTNNERIIHDNLQQFFNKRTVIIVAHRLSTVRAADQIIVMKKGQIIEKGTHKELIAIKGEYYTLVKNQLELGD